MPSLDLPEGRINRNDLRPYVPVKRAVRRVQRNARSEPWFTVSNPDSSFAIRGEEPKPVPVKLCNHPCWPNPFAEPYALSAAAAICFADAIYNSRTTPRANAPTCAPTPLRVGAEIQRSTA